MTPALRVGITVCVEYDDLLAITLPRNRGYFENYLIITTPADARTQAIAAANDAAIFATDLFYKDGAPFAKGLAMEAGFDVAGRCGWMAIIDADTLWPKHIDFGFLQAGKLYTPQRRFLENPADWNENLNWTLLRVSGPGEEFAGYTQIFHADSKPLEKRPWYATQWAHAGGCDSRFHKIWPPQDRHRPPFECLHLGLDGRNWHGRWTPRIDGEPIPDAEERKRKNETMHHGRRTRPHHRRYEGEWL